MSEVRRLAAKDYDDFITIVANAYPDFKVTSPDDRARFRSRLEALSSDTPAGYYGHYRDDTLLGGMRLYDFDMNVRGTQIPTGGVGLVAVDIFHKKEHVARDMIRYFVDAYRERNMPFVTLYPFRPDFYKQMGFGYGTKLNQYHVEPTGLPKTGDRTRVTPVSADEKHLVRESYNRYAASTHGMMQKSDLELSRIFDNSEMRVGGYRGANGLEGYVTFSYAPYEADQIMHYEMKVHELIYEHRDALLGLLAFLRSQFDQVTRIEFNTQDENFQYLLTEPRDGSNRVLPHVYHQTNVQGIGIMYRVVDVPGAFEMLKEANFGGQNLTLNVNVRDTFLPENAGGTLVRFTDGRPKVVAEGKTDAEITLDVAEFSALLMGCVDFASLHTYGLADISDSARIEDVTRLFAVPRKPICMTAF